MFWNLLKKKSEPRTFEYLLSIYKEIKELDFVLDRGKCVSLDDSATEFHLGHYGGGTFMFNGKNLFSYCTSGVYGREVISFAYCSVINGHNSLRLLNVDEKSTKWLDNTYLTKEEFMHISKTCFELLFSCQALVARRAVMKEAEIARLALEEKKKTESRKTITDFLELYPIK